MGYPLMQSWAEMIGAFGTGAGFLIAALVFRRAAADSRDAQAGQARLVYITVDGAESHWVVTAHNPSSAPLRKAAMIVQHRKPGGEVETTVGEQADVIRPLDGRYVGVELKGTPVADGYGGHGLAPDAPRVIDVIVVFLDAQGLWWELHLSTGIPHRVKQPGRLRLRLTPAETWLRSNLEVLRRSRRHR